MCFYSLVRILVAGWIAALPLCSFARVGESASIIEGRLMAERRAIRVDVSTLEKGARPPQNTLSAFTAAIGKVAEKKVLKYEVLTYFKRDVNENIDRKDRDVIGLNLGGWWIQILYVGDISIAEAYSKEGSAMSEFERDGLIAINRGKQNWLVADQLTEEQRAAFSQPKVPRIMPFAYIREDGVIAANQSGNSLVIYDTAIHNELAALVLEISKESVPDSLIGF